MKSDFCAFRFAKGTFRSKVLSIFPGKEVITTRKPFKNPGKKSNRKEGEIYQ
jgi:hypothetical protein